MTTNSTPDVFDRVPEWWSESARGLGLVLAATFALVGGSRLLSMGIAALEVTGSSATVVESVTGLVLTLVPLAVLWAAVGFGTTYVYLARRGFEPGFVLERPDREAVRWLARLLALAVVLVWGGTIVASLRVGSNSGILLRTPGVFVGSIDSMPVTTRGVDLAVFAPLTILLFAGVVGPALGVLFHGVLQNSLRRVVPGTIAVAATAVVLPVLAMTGGDLLGLGLVAVFAAAVGYAYERTENLAVPMLAYAALNAFTLTTALVFLLSTMGRI